MRRQDGRKLAHNTLEEMRIRAVERVQAGESPEVVVRALGLSRAAIYGWLSRFRDGGFEALKAKPVPGRPRRLTGRQMRWVYETVTRKSPEQMRFAFALWTREYVKRVIARQFSVHLSLSSVSRLLSELGLTWQKPLYRAYQQDAVRVEKWLREEFPAIRRRAKELGAEIFFGDEAAVRTDQHAGKTWGIKGKTPVVLSTGARYRVNMISAISGRGSLRFMVLAGNLTAPRFIQFLRRLLVGAKRPLFLILDGHSVHRSRAVKRFVETSDGNLHLFLLPPYSPELNPDELVWNHVKSHGVGRSFVAGAGHLKRLVSARLRALQNQPHKVRSFFQAPTTRYAAAA